MIKIKYELIDKKVPFEREVKVRKISHSNYFLLSRKIVKDLALEKNMVIEYFLKHPDYTNDPFQEKKIIAWGHSLIVALPSYYKVKQNQKIQVAIFPKAKIVECDKKESNFIQLLNKVSLVFKELTENEYNFEIIYALRKYADFYDNEKRDQYIKKLMKDPTESNLDRIKHVLFYNYIINHELTKHNAKIITELKKNPGLYNYNSKKNEILLTFCKIINTTPIHLENYQKIN